MIKFLEIRFFSYLISCSTQQIFILNPYLLIEKTLYCSLLLNSDYINQLRKHQNLRSNVSSEQVLAGASLHASVLTEI